MTTNVIDFERKKALKNQIAAQIEEFNRDIDEFPGIARRTSCHAEKNLSIKVIKDGKVSKLPCLAYAVDDQGTFLCMTMTGERVGYMKNQVLA